MTGATGFVGKAVVKRLVGEGHQVMALGRRPIAQDETPAQQTVSVDLASAAPADLLNGQDLVVHLAARAHARGSTPEDFERDTIGVARNVARQAARAGVGRAILLSSIGARIAEERDSGAREYGRAKLRAEHEFRGALDGTGCRLITLRPPVIYGPDAPGSFGSLVHWVSRGRPLPFGMARSKRSYLSRHNLVDLLAGLASADDDRWKAADGLVFEPSDGHPISTRDLSIAIGKAVARPARLLPIPPLVLRSVGKLLGKAELASGALDTLIVQPQPSLEDYFGWAAEARLPETLEFLKPASMRR